MWFWRAGAGALTGVAGRHAIAATTVAIERVVLRHMHEQIVALDGIDEPAVRTLLIIVAEEQEHHNLSAARLSRTGIWQRLIDPIVSASTETVIWLGMRI